MDEAGTVKLLGSTQVFSDLSQKELGLIARQAKEMTFSPGDLLTSEGHEGGRFFIVCEGDASVSIGGEQMGRVGPGDSFGEIALIDGRPRSASVVAETPMRVMTLASWNFRPLLTEYPSITLKLLLQMCARLREAEGAH